MSYPLRLPPELDAAARERCRRLGISLNALIAVALDEYLVRSGTTAPSSRVAAAKFAKPRMAANPSAGVQRDSERLRGKPTFSATGPQRWKEFEDPDVWPFIDDDPVWLAEFEVIAGDEDINSPAVMQRLEAAYWATRKRPVSG